MKLRTKDTPVKKSRLVQRLRKPRQNTFLGVDNPFAFGGGLRNGGLSDEAMAILRQVFSFDYMGAAEFEWGAVPEALQGMAKDAKNLVAFPFGITKDQKIYVLCRNEHNSVVVERIIIWAGEQINYNLKEQTRLYNALNPRSEWDTETCGWLELDNGFFFFTDEQMWRDTAAIFGVEVPS
jgi:rhodanese-related sulfurtransferase